MALLTQYAAESMQRFGVRPPVRLSVCPIYRSLQQRAAGLLLCARRADDIDRLLHGRRSAATPSSVTCQLA